MEKEYSGYKKEKYKNSVCNSMSLLQKRISDLFGEREILKNGRIIPVTKQIM